MMAKPRLSLWLFSLLLTLAPHLSASEGTLNGCDLAVRSTGQSHGGAWTLDGNGYVGTYLRVDQPGSVRVRVATSGQHDKEIHPNLTVVLANHHESFAAQDSSETFETHADLPAGTYFLRLQFDNAAPGANIQLHIEKLWVSGALIVNQHTDRLALDAADTYIRHYRQGRIGLALPSELAGQQASIKLIRGEMLIGGISPGVSNVYLDPNAAPGSDAARYQRAMRELFNVTVPSNAGKWEYNEATPGTVTMNYPDAILKFAADHDMAARMHALIWDTEQQPAWVHVLLDAAKAGDADAKQQLRQAINRRIDYYVADRAAGYTHLDVINESFHQPGYLDIFGVEGIADIFRDTAQAVRRANTDTKLFVNEYNILQWSREPPYDQEDTEPDPFANWYRSHVDQLRHHGAPLTGIGVQYYADARPDTSQPHSPARIAQVFHNLAVTGLPIALTEFGVDRGATPQQAATVLTDTIRLTFGQPDGELFLMFGFFRGATWERSAEACLYDSDWNLTIPGQRFVELTKPWQTETTATISEDGTISFQGYYGLYEVTVNGDAYRFMATQSVR